MKELCTRFSSRLLATRISIHVIALAAILSASMTAQAQIPVVPGVNPTITFGAAPVLTVDQWATLTAGIGAAGAGTFTTPAQLDAAAQNVNQSSINLALPAFTGNHAANANGRHKTDEGLLVTQPTTVAANVIKASLSNASASAYSEVTVAYSYVGGAAAAGSDDTEIPGQRVYWSLLGTPNSWALLPSLSGVVVASNLSATIQVTNWASGTVMYLMWLDDNAATNPDGTNTIDNFVITAVTSELTCVGITNQSGNITVPERGAATFSIMATGSPQNVQWFRQESGGGGFTAIPGANGGSYIIPSAAYPGDNGAQFFAILSNSMCQATSTVVTLTVTADTTAPTVISAIGDINPADSQPTLVYLTFSEPMDVNTISEANFSVFVTGTDPDDPMTPPLVSFSAILTNGSNVIVTTEARLPLTDYSIRLLDIRDGSSGNNATDPNPLSVPLKINELLIGFDANNLWKWTAETNLFGTGWETVGYDDSDPLVWPEGPAGLGNDADNAVPLRTTTAYTPNSAPQFFRRHFFLPSGTNGLTLSMRHCFEDGAVVYINGQEAGRYNVNPGTLTVATRAPGGPAAVAPIAGPVLLPLTNVLPGDNVIAVVVIQTGATSSDTFMAIELKATISEFADGPPVIETQPATQTVPEGTSVVTLSAGVDGAVPLYYQWRSNGVDIAGANNASYTLFNAKPSYSATYSVFVTNALGTATSSNAVLTVVPDTTSPTLWGVNVDSNRTQLTLSFSKPLETASAQTPGNYTVQPIGGSPIGVTTAVLNNNTNVVLTLDSALVDGQSLNLVFNGVVDRTEAVHQVSPRTNGVASLVSLSAAHNWRYNQDGIDLGTAWQGTSFSDSGWSNGAALFDVVRGATRATVGGEPVRTVLSLTNNQVDPNATTNITWYFRTHFNLPVSSNNVPTRINLFLDDGAVFYINNVEAYRNGITNVPVYYTNFAQTSVGTASRMGSFVVDGSSMVAGDNVLAVEVHQTSLGSSDVTLGVELYALIPGGLPNVIAPQLNILQDGLGQTTITWTRPGCTLEETTQLATPSANTVWGPSAVVNGVPFTPTGTSKFYRLNCP